MENLAYLHLAFDYEDCPSGEMDSFRFLLNKGTSLEWGRLSSKAWRYMLPLALTLSLMTAMSSAFALQKGDQGPSVRELQLDLKRGGFYQAPITQVYDTRTEEAVRRFQKAAFLQVNGIAGPTTIGKLENWQASSPNVTQKKPTAQNVGARASSSHEPQKLRVGRILGRGDEGEEIRVLQERLRVAGYYYGNSSGIFGSITEDAVKRFQEAYNLQADGIVGPATLRRLPPIGVGYGEENPQRKIDPDKLSLGDRGETVRVLQEQLIKAGYLEGEPNGYFGPYTADAVRRFQGKNYLSASGIAGPTTRAKLYSLVNVNPGSGREFNVLEIQRRLRARGFYKGPLNGVLGSDTKRAIKQAQEFYGISLSDMRSGLY